MLAFRLGPTHLPGFFQLAKAAGRWYPSGSVLKQNTKHHDIVTDLRMGPAATVHNHALYWVVLNQLFGLLNLEGFAILQKAIPGDAVDVSLHKLTP